MQKAIIVVDNLRIGGFQRLALDQGYGLSDLGYEVILIVLGDTDASTFHSLHKAEVQLISFRNIVIEYAGNSHFDQIKILKKNLKRELKISLLLCHSLRGTMLLRFSQIYQFHRIKFATTIHQLPSLSESKQRWRRFLYAQFTDSLFAYSESVKLDWQNNITDKGFWAKLLFRKKICVMRNGIYLERLPSAAISRQVHVKGQKPRLIYLGRNTIWKGLGTFLQLLECNELMDFDFLLMVPSIEGIPIEILNTHSSRLEILVGKTIADLTVQRGDVHVYPTNYGAGIEIVESVSLNVLEFAALGVPSVISRNGAATWPELLSAGLFYEVDWKNREIVSEKLIAASRFELETATHNLVREETSILSNLQKTIDFMGSGGHN